MMNLFKVLLNGFSDSCSPSFIKVVIWCQFLKNSKYSLQSRNGIVMEKQMSSEDELTNRAKTRPKAASPPAPQIKHETIRVSIWTLKEPFKTLALDVFFPGKIHKLFLYFRIFNLQESIQDNECINLLNFSLSLSDVALLLLPLSSRQSLLN